MLKLDMIILTTSVSLPSITALPSRERMMLLEQRGPYRSFQKLRSHL